MIDQWMKAAEKVILTRDKTVSNKIKKMRSIPISVFLTLNLKLTQCAYYQVAETGVMPVANAIINNVAGSDVLSCAQLCDNVV